MAEKLNFGHLGNGVTVWDSSREVDHDYPTVAHISYERTVSYREQVSPEARQHIEHFARYENMNISYTQHIPALRPIADSAFMSSAEKDSFLRHYGCSADGVEPFIRDVWDDTKSPLENLDHFRRWWADGKVKEYMG